MGVMTTVPPVNLRAAMSDPTDRLRLVQWLSPAFPIGAFAYSQGLEYAISEGEVRTAKDLAQWITAILRHGSGRADAILLAQARAPCADLAALSDLALALAPSAERVTEMMEQGRAFATTISAITGQHHPARPYAVAVGVATAPLNIPTAEVLTLWLHGLSAQLTSAATRFVPLGQTEAQQVLAALAPRITDLAAEYATLPLSALSSTTPRADLAAMRHETMPVRIFRT
jgi:urease accessory protein